MESYLKIIFLSIILALFDGISSDKLSKSSETSENQTINDRNVVKIDNKSADLVASDQHFSYSYAKDGDHSYDNKDYAKNGKSYLKEVHYFHDKEVGYERKHDWNSDNDEEIASKKVKKDLYNKRNYGKSYDSNDMIEIKKWDDEEPNHHSNNNFNEGNNDNNGNYNNFDDNNKSKLRLYSNIKLNNNNQNFKSDDNKDNNNYKQRKYSTGERGRQDYSGYDEDNQKWFTNMEDKHQSGSTYNEVKDEDNYNNFNSPKFMVNFNSFKPWNKIMRSRRHENNDNNHNMDKISDNYQDNYEIYSNSQSHNEDTESDHKFNYEPKILTNLNIEITDKNKDNNNNESYGKNIINSNDKTIRYKATDFKERGKKLKSRPKNMRYHYEKRVEPQVYGNSQSKGDGYGNGYDPGSSDGNYPSMKNQMERKFIEMPYDMFNTGWSSVQKPMRHQKQRTNRKVVPKVKQYRFGF